jgi:hypothetical protein
MRPQAHITFDQCLPLLVRAVRELVPSVDFAELRVVRDMHGRLYLMVPDNWSDSVVDALKEKLQSVLDHYSPGTNGVARYQRHSGRGSAFSGAHVGPLGRWRKRAPD